MNVLLGVTSGIAAYKIPFLIRQFLRGGDKIEVIPTRNALKMVTETVLYTICGEPPLTETFPNQYSSDPMYHISLAKWADVFAIAPCTANTIGKLAAGIGDNLLTSTALAYNGVKVIAPAMNTNMWNNEIVQRNIAELKDRGYFIIPPATGELACGDEGSGRLPELEYLQRSIISYASFGLDLRGLRLFVTAGASREYIDPVRFISNPSTGKMGYEIAQNAVLRGAEVIFAAPASVKRVEGAKNITAESVSDFVKIIDGSMSDFDILISAAAFADFTPEKRSGAKIKKDAVPAGLNLRLQKTTDILSRVKRQDGAKRLIGFALETNDLIKNASEKLKEKGLEFIVANRPSNFGVDSGDFIIIDKSGNERYESRTKKDMANIILNRLK